MQPKTGAEAAALATVLDYHERTKHHLQRYANGPETLDWDAQPAPFRSYAPTTEQPLPLLQELPPEHPVRRALSRAYARESCAEPPPAFGLASLGVLLQCALGITAWKSYGPDRWAVRANPSSGNLHPIEAYVLSTGLSDLPDGIYHYEPQAHRLELRARPHDAQWLPSEAPRIAIALTSLMWREAWKYGERAFRYCQLDAGHAMAALSVAAAALGTSLRPCPARSAEGLRALLGLDRPDDFPERGAVSTETEEPELVLELHGPALSLACAADALAGASLSYFGAASRVDRRPMYRWPVIDEVAAATRAAPTPQDSPAPRSHGTGTGARSERTIAQVLLGRRSAQRFDIRYELDAPAFFEVLRATLPAAGAPWEVLQSAPALDLVLFVHRVAGLAPGLYLLERRGARSRELRGALSQRYTPEPLTASGAPAELSCLAQAEPAQLMRVARLLHCHQDIAANSCFALGMLADLERELQRGAGAYRALLREAGVIGQQLYLAAEACGLRGTGIGCYFDDAFHELLGLSGRFQSLYHFTLGRALDDTRIETGPAYPQRQP